MRRRTCTQRDPCNQLLPTQTSSPCTRTRLFPVCRTSFRSRREEHPLGWYSSFRGRQRFTTLNAASARRAELRGRVPSASANTDEPLTPPSRQPIAHGQNYPFSNRSTPSSLPPKPREELRLPRTEAPSADRNLFALLVCSLSRTARGEDPCFDVPSRCLPVLRHRSHLREPSNAGPMQTRAAKMEASLPLPPLWRTPFHSGNS